MMKEQFAPWEVEHGFAQQEEAPVVQLCCKQWKALYNRRVLKNQAPRKIVVSKMTGRPVRLFGLDQTRPVQLP